MDSSDYQTVGAKVKKVVPIVDLQSSTQTDDD